MQIYADADSDIFADFADRVQLYRNFFSDCGFMRKRKSATYADCGFMRKKYSQLKHIVDLCGKNIRNLSGFRIYADADFCGYR